VYCKLKVNKTINLLRKVRHNTFLKKLKFWLILGNFFRKIILIFKIKFSTSHKIGEYGPFKIDGYFSFSNFNDWGNKHNNCFKLLIESSKNKKCILDIGGHIGLVTLPLSTNIPEEGKIYVFEPSSANLYYLKRHIFLNNISNVVVVDKLIGDKDQDKIDFHESLQPSGMNALNISDKNLDYEIKLKSMITIDSYVKQNNLKPDIIKIDVEGAEELVLSGANYVLEHFKPIIFLSIHPKLMQNHGGSTRNLLENLKQKNYDIFDSNGNMPELITNNEYILKPNL